MNRVIIVGNGFDIAHGLKTRYTDFIEYFWKNIRTFGKENICTDKVVFWDGVITISRGGYSGSMENIVPLIDGKRWTEIEGILKNIGSKLTIKNKFLKRISRNSNMENWSGIEEEYFNCLSNQVAGASGHYLDDTAYSFDDIKGLNNDLKFIQKALEEYLLLIRSNKKIPSINKVLQSPFKLDDFSQKWRKEILSKASHKYIDSGGVVKPILGNKLKLSVSPEHTLFLNFNYTNTEKLYQKSKLFETIHIHGELCNKKNPMILGYGDEIGEEYKKIELKKNDEYLRYMKSMCYLETANITHLLNFIESSPYQVFTLGHSCGISDRTLLNKLFEHNNCASIKVFYYQWKDKKTGEIKDDYSDIVRRISRHFSDNTIMRERVVSRPSSEPLIPCKTNC